MNNVLISEQWQRILAADKVIRVSAQQVLGGSEYANEWGQCYEERAQELISSGDIHLVYDDDAYQQRLNSRLKQVSDNVMLQQKLRYFRQREMVRIIWRDLAGWADLSETTGDLSRMADTCIQQALAVLHQWQSDDLGVPCNSRGEEQELLVLGMGKLGASELNLSSDVDLIFSFPEKGYTQGGYEKLSNEEFFIRLGHKLIQALDLVTADGFVFRVDMRLRPFGESGALVSCFDSMEDYYQTQGREWERYAMIKARAITGSEESKEKLMDLLRPFVFRRYLDYGVFDSLREMKTMISGQLRSKGMENNIKLGEGGIREIEFIGQVFQLIHGGRDLPLQQRPILTVLDLLSERQFLSQSTIDELKRAYIFLRRVEHRIQAFADKQTHQLPEDKAGLLRIAKLMGFNSSPDFLFVLGKYRSQVQSHFELLLTRGALEDIEEVSLLTSVDEEKVSYLTGLGFQKPKVIVSYLAGLLESNAYQKLGDIERLRLTRLLPLIVRAASSLSNADICLRRLMPLLESILRRTAYMSLLVENPLALAQLIKLCDASPWISSQLASYPVLLDELLDSRSLYGVPQREEQTIKLLQTLDVVHETDLEQHMYLLREFKQIASLHVAAADITNVLPLMKVGDQLTELAEILIEQVLKLAWQHLVLKYGRPPCTTGDDLNTCGFTVLAYGKFGGYELGYGSDLDLAFLYDSNINNGFTDGEKPIEALVFYTRLAQRMIHLLSTVTAGGILYEIDLRLRPNGLSGLLVTDISGFKDYQQEDAWTWEHQALVRARCVTGDEVLSKRIESIRQQILGQERNLTILTKDVSKMRAKMREQLNKSTIDLFDLKQGKGGIADIEFMVQYAVLAWSSATPDLLIYTDTIRSLEALIDSGKLSGHESSMLADAYRFYRKLANYCILQEKPTVVPAQEVAKYRTQVIGIWLRWFE